MAATKEMIGIAMEVIPDQVTLVPELPGEITTTGGLDCTRNQEAITSAIKHLQSNNINVSLFIDPAESQIRAALSLGARTIELNTGHNIIARAALVGLERAVREMLALL